MRTKGVHVVWCVNYSYRTQTLYNVVGVPTKYDTTCVRPSRAHARRYPALATPWSPDGLFLPPAKKVMTKKKNPDQHWKQQQWKNKEDETKKGQ